MVCASILRRIGCGIGLGGIRSGRRRRPVGDGLAAAATNYPRWLRRGDRARSGQQYRLRPPVRAEVRLETGRPPVGNH